MCSARCSARSCSISAGTSCSRRGEYQLLIYSGVMILLIVLLPNGLLSLRLPSRRGELTMAPILTVRDLTKRYGGLDRGQRGLVRRRAERDPVGHRAQRRGQVDHLQAHLVLREADARRGEVQRRGDLGARAAYRGAQRGRAHLPGDDDLQGDDGARQRHRRPSSALAREPLRLLFRHGGGRARRGRIRPLERRDPRVPRPRAGPQRDSRATCRRGTCARSASPSGSPPIRRSCCSTSRSPA